MSIIAAVICVGVVMCGVVPAAEKNSRLAVGFSLQFLVPIVLCIIATAVFRQQTVRDARALIESVYTAGSAADLSFRVKAAYGILVTALAVQLLGFLLAVFRMGGYVAANRDLKDEVAARAPYGSADSPGGGPAAKTDRGFNGAGPADGAAPEEMLPTHRVMVDERLAHRLVNDDWGRQVQIWEQRKAAVVRVLRQRVAAQKAAAAPGPLSSDDAVAPASAAPQAASDSASPVVRQATATPPPAPK